MSVSDVCVCVGGGGGVSAIVGHRLNAMALCNL